LLKERRRSLRSLALEIGVSQSHLWRVVHEPAKKTTTAELALRTARALGLPDDYFPEFREAAVVGAVQGDGALRDELYDNLRAGR
jgi:hypothetical protein